MSRRFDSVPVLEWIVITGSLPWIGRCGLWRGGMPSVRQMSCITATDLLVDGHNLRIAAVYPGSTGPLDCILVFETRGLDLFLRVSVFRDSRWDELSSVRVRTYAT